LVHKPVDRCACKDDGKFIFCTGDAIAGEGGT
jgi:hypothetical protein